MQRPAIVALEAARDGCVGEWHALRSAETEPVRGAERVDEAMAFRGGVRLERGEGRLGF